MATHVEVNESTEMETSKCLNTLCKAAFCCFSKKKKKKCYRIFDTS